MASVNVYLPSDRVQIFYLLTHVLPPVVSIHDCVDLEGHLVCHTPLPHSMETVQVVLVALPPSDHYVGVLIKAVTRNGKDVQVLTWRNYACVYNMKK